MVSTLRHAHASPEVVLRPVKNVAGSTTSAYPLASVRSTPNLLALRLQAERLDEEELELRHCPAALCSTCLPRYTSVVSTLRHAHASPEVVLRPVKNVAGSTTSAYPLASVRSTPNLLALRLQAERLDEEELELARQLHETTLDAEAAPSIPVEPPDVAVPANANLNVGYFPQPE